MISGKKLTIVEKHAQKLHLSDNEDEKKVSDEILYINDQDNPSKGKDSHTFLS